MKHPDPDGPPDRRPIAIGEIWENPVTREYATVLELPWHNQESRGVAELSALVGARVMGEHLHPSIVERFTPLEGELMLKRNGQTSILPCGETAVIEPVCGMTGGTRQTATFEYALKSRPASASCT